jgi:hypothetical protein
VEEIVIVSGELINKNSGEIPRKYGVKNEKFALTRTLNYMKN